MLDAGGRAAVLQAVMQDEEGQALDGLSQRQFMRWFLKDVSRARKLNPQKFAQALRTYDTDGTGALEKLEVGKLFDKYDADGSRSLDRQEVTRLLRELGHRHKPDDVSTMMQDCRRLSRGLTRKAFIRWWASNSSGLCTISNSCESAWLSIDNGPGRLGAVKRH